MPDLPDLLDTIANDLEATRRRLIPLVGRADALADLLGRAIELADRLGRVVTLADLEADAKGKGAAELARFHVLIQTVDATGHAG